VALVSPATPPDDRERLNGLIKKIGAQRSYVGVPAPAFAEFLVKSDAATAAILLTFERKAALRILPFDRKAAVQCALLDRAAHATGKKRGSAAQNAPWQKIKVDRQIVAIALANNAELIVAQDGDIPSIAADAGVPATTIESLELPEWAKQGKLDLSQSPY